MRKLDEKYSRELAVIGVHAGKFNAERVTENIRQAVLRLDVEHPVVNDRFFRVWKAYSVSAWPTIVLVDPEGKYVGSQPGEIMFETFDPVIGQVIEEFDSRGLIDRRPLPSRPEKQASPEQFLSFPGKVLYRSPGRLFVADSGHNRLLELRSDGDGRTAKVVAMAGSGASGLADGGFESAKFHHPQGMALDGDTLYVADTENHAIQSVDLGRRQVTTIAGTGEQSLFHGGHGRAKETPLSSPWDVAISDGVLYIAMAGVHQIWSLDLKTGSVQPWAGNGLEDIADGALHSASLAQTMGMALAGDRLYFADAESSGVRWAGTGQGGKVNTIAGTGLFDFGDRDGVGDGVLMQHCQGIGAHGGQVYVADTYNNKIKLVDPVSRRVTTFLGTGEPGYRDGPDPTFDEPSGVCAGDGKLFIADTNNHLIRVADLQTREVWTMDVR
ncbi:MAG: hypothetical protein M1319_01785, partial [Chloroflexi bacterium]|nr:hypothetical protein [Chloroflexota bacterium]